MLAPDLKRYMLTFQKRPTKSHIYVQVYILCCRFLFRLIIVYDNIFVLPPISGFINSSIFKYFFSSVHTFGKPTYRATLTHKFTLYIYIHIYIHLTPF